MRPSVLTLLAAGGLLLTPLHATTVFFGSGGVGNTGTVLDNSDSLIVPVGLTLTAGFGLDGAGGAGTDTLPTDDPLFNTDVAEVGTLYWGDLGDMADTDCDNDGSTAAPPCYGVGVQNATGSGSLGISGNGGHQNEAVIFTWALGYEPVATSVQITIVGYHNLIGSSGDTDRDILDLFLEFAPSNGTPSDIVIYNFLLPSTGSSIINLGTDSQFTGLAAIPNGALLKSAAVQIRQGHAGIGGLEYTEAQIPEPSTLVLLSGGLLALAGLRRFRRG